MFEKAKGKLKPSSSFSPTSGENIENEEREPSISGKFKVTGILTVGKEVNLALILKNLTSDMKTVTVNMTAWTIVYNGTLVHEVWKDSVTISLDPEEGNSSYSFLRHHATKVAVGVGEFLSELAQLSKGGEHRASVVKPWVLKFWKLLP